MMWKKSLFLLAGIAAVCGGMGSAAADFSRGEAGTLDFSRAVIVTPSDLDGPQQKAVTVLREEIQKRTGIALEQTAQWPESPRPVIAVGLQSRIEQFAGPFAAELEKTRLPGPEGFGLAVQRQPREAILIVASDPRGLLYGIGRLLRKWSLRRTQCWFLPVCESSRRPSIRSAATNWDIGPR
jgi:hypothetical protein